MNRMLSIASAVVLSAAVPMSEFVKMEEQSREVSTLADQNGCSDLLADLGNGQKRVWHDIDGAFFNCYIYAKYGLCTAYSNYGPWPQNMPMTASQACCHCGGGDTSSTSAPVPSRFPACTTDADCAQYPDATRCSIHGCQECDFFTNDNLPCLQKGLKCGTDNVDIYLYRCCDTNSFGMCIDATPAPQIVSTAVPTAAPQGNVPPVPFTPFPYPSYPACTTDADCAQYPDATRCSIHGCQECDFSAYDDLPCLQKGLVCGTDNVNIFLYRCCVSQVFPGICD